MITIDQIRAGRALARLTQAQLAAQAGISSTAMNNIENGTDAKGSTLSVVQAALESDGIEFEAHLSPFLNLMPGPPPFSPMNSSLVDSIVRRIC